MVHQLLPPFILSNILGFSLKIVDKSTPVATTQSDYFGGGRNIIVKLSTVCKSPKLGWNMF